MGFLQDAITSVAIFIGVASGDVESNAFNINDCIVPPAIDVRAWSYSYPDTDECWEAMNTLGDDEHKTNTGMVIEEL